MANLGRYATDAKPMPGGSLWFKLFPGFDNYTPPASATEALTGYEELGELTEDGLAEDISISTSGVKGWSGTEIISSLDEFSNTFKFGLSEIMFNTLNFMWGGDQTSNLVTGEDGGAIVADQSPASFEKEFSFVAISVLSDGRIWRKVIPRAKITSVETVNYKRGAGVFYVITIKALGGAFGSGALAKVTARNLISAPGTYTDTMSAPTFNGDSDDSTDEDVTVTGVVVTPSEVTLAVGGHQSLYAVASLSGTGLAPSDAVSTWASDDTSGATVTGGSINTNTGNVAAVATGEATITCTLTANGETFTDTVAVTVTTE